MNYYGYNGYNNYGYPQQSFYNLPMQDQLSQLRNNNQFQQPIQQNNFPNQPMPPQAQQNNNQNNNIIWVQGEEGAKAFLVGAGNTVILWDSENPVIYIKSADANGVPSMRVLDWTERTGTSKTPLDNVQNQANNYVTREEWTALTARVDALTGKAENKSKKSVKENDE